MDVSAKPSQRLGKGPQSYHDIAGNDQQPIIYLVAAAFIAAYDCNPIRLSDPHALLVKQALELHQLLTGYEDPSVFVFSNILWDLGRWLFLSEIAEPER